jgi:hypothetical protein
VAALLVGHLLRDTPGFVVRGENGDYHGDITHYVYWTRLVTQGGIQSAYSGSWPETYAVYPPVSLYAYQVVGGIYRLVEDPTFDPQRAQRSAFLHEGIKAVALAFHLATALALFFLAGRLYGSAAGALAGSVYVLNPAALYDVANWGQPDGAHALFSVLAVGALSLGWLARAWCAMAVAALAKPQAWSILPLLSLATLRIAFFPGRQGSSNGAAVTDGARLTGGFVACSRAGLAAASVALVVVLPFILTGHLRDLLSLPRVISSVMPVVSADAHNFWWLVMRPLGQEPLFVEDSVRVLGPLSFRVLAGLLVLGSNAFACWLYWTDRASLAESSGMAVLGWFVFTTQAHENHLFFALPLLALALPGRRRLFAPYAVMSVTLLLNMALHDELVLEALGLPQDGLLVGSLRVLNAAFNVSCFAAWSAWAALRPAPAGALVRVQPAAEQPRQLLLPGSSVRSS